MASLHDFIKTPEMRNKIVDHSLRVLDAEVADKRGIGGIAVKTGYKVVNGIQPGFIRGVVDNLLDEFLTALDPIYQEALEKGVPPRDHLVANPNRVAESLLAITDAKATRAKNKIVKKTYDKLRSGAKEHVMAAVPRLGDMLATYVSAT
jgi:hypothetical protein